MRCFIMRIANNDYVERVFNANAYYTAMRRRFEEGDVVLFARKTKVDSFIGLGVVGRVKQLSEMNEEERDLCISHNWFWKIEFKNCMRFKTPLPIKTVFPGLHKLGNRIHGLELSRPEYERIVRLAFLYEKGELTQ